MPRNCIEASAFSPDTLEFIAFLRKHRVRYLIVGSEAVIYYGHARLTGDVDFFYEASVANTSKLYAALKEFWRGKIPGIRTEKELRTEIPQIGGTRSVASPASRDGHDGA